MSIFTTHRTPCTVPDFFFDLPDPHQSHRTFAACNLFIFPFSHAVNVLRQSTSTETWRATLQLLSSPSERPLPALQGHRHHPLPLPAPTTSTRHVRSSPSCAKQSPLRRTFFPPRKTCAEEKDTSMKICGAVDCTLYQTMTSLN